MPCAYMSVDLWCQRYIYGVWVHIISKTIIPHIDAKLLYISES